MLNLNLSSEYAKTQIDKNLYRFRDPGSIRFADSNIRRPYYWDKAKCRVLFVFLSTIQSRAIAATEQVLFNLIYKQFGYDVYPDLVYLPEKENIPLYKELNIPVIMGCVSNKVWKDFDLILVSNSTVEEKQNYPWMLYHSDIPLWYTQRMKHEDIPFVFLGGNASDMSDNYLGKSDDSDDFSLIDGAFIGQGEGLIDKVLIKFMEGREKGLKKEKFLRSFFSIKSFLHPEQFIYEYEDNGWHIKRVVKNPKFPEAPDRVEYNHHEDPNQFPGFERKIMLPVINSPPVSADLQISWACSSGGSCSFCKEAHVQGGWREKTLEKLKDEIISLKMYAQPTKIGLFSFNTNYYSQYFGLIREAAKVMSRFVFIGMRADVISARPDYFLLSKQLGQRRISFGLEGLSNRVRNGYLNKNLSDEEFFKACEVCFRLRFVEIKLNIINTGIEDNQDFDEFMDMLQRLIDRRDEIGSKTVFRISITNLCYFPETPLQWEPRRTVQQMIDRERNWDHFFEEMYKRFKRDMWMDIGNMSGIQFIYPQFILDLHRKATPIMVKSSIKEGILYHRVIKPEYMRWLYKELEERGYSVKELTAERPDDFIFPGSYVYTLKKSYLRMMRDNVRKAITERSEKPVPQCLATPAKPDKRKCFSCGYCTTPEMKKKRLVRKFDDMTTVDETLQAIALNRPKYCMILKFTRKERFRFVHPLTSWYYGVARIFREMGKESALKVYKIEDCWDKPQSKDQLADFVYGTMMGTMLLREPVSIEEMKSAYERVKDEIETTVFEGGREVPLDFRLNKHTHQMFIVNIYEQDYSLIEKIRAFDGRVKVVQKNGGAREPKFVLRKMDLPEILFFNGNYKSGSYFVVSIPYQVNIYAFVSSVLNISFGSVLQKCKALRICYYTKGMSVCVKCGEPAMFDLYLNKDSSFCEECYRRAIVIKLKKRIE